MKIDIQNAAVSVRNLAPIFQPRCLDISSHIQRRKIAPIAKFYASEDSDKEAYVSFGYTANELSFEVPEGEKPSLSGDFPISVDLRTFGTVEQARAIHAELGRALDEADRA